MSNGKIPKPPPFEPVRCDYTTPMARMGEEQFAIISRNRSGMDAGEIDFGLRELGHLAPYDRQRVVDMAYALYEAACDQTGMRAVKADLRALEADELVAEVVTLLGVLMGLADTKETQKRAAAAIARIATLMGYVG